MAQLTHYSKSFLGMVETGERAATGEVVDAYEKALGGAILGDDMWRKEIRKPNLLIVRGPKALREHAANLASGDPGIITRAASAHWTDVGLAAHVDQVGAANLRRWMADGETSTLRANALSVVAKLPGEQNATAVVRALQNDEMVRRLCLTAIVSRTCQFDWPTSQGIVQDPSTAPNAKRLAAKMAKEATNPRDTESRWCGSFMLMQLAAVGR
jgi:hypothetical protein